MTNSWEDLIARKITGDEYDYLTEVVEELETTVQYLSNQKHFIDSLGIDNENDLSSLSFHGKKFRKVCLRDGTICMSCKELK